MLSPTRFRILMLAACPLPLPRGSQVLIAGLAKALQQRGHTVEVVAYPGGAPGSPLAVPVRRVAPLPFYRQQDSGPSLWKLLLDLRLAGQALVAAREFHPDVLHAHNFEGLLVGLWLRRRTDLPLVYHQHNLLEPELPTYFRFPPVRWFSRRIGHWVDANLPRRCDACIVLHAEAAAYLRRFDVAPERVQIIPPGIDLPEHVAVPAEAVRRRWGLGPGPLVLYSGNLDHYQDLEFLLQAFRRVQAARPDAILVLATHQGSATHHERALRRILGPGEYLLPEVSWAEMSDLLAIGDVAVSPRQVCWGFPIKVLNYMVAARPIVAATGSAQGLRHQETAWVVPNGDETAFAGAIVALLGDRELAGRLGRAARHEVETRYTWPACAEATERLYGQLVAPHVPPASIISSE